jgi:hypothetical protein
VHSALCVVQYPFWRHWPLGGPKALQFSQPRAAPWGQRSRDAGFSAQRAKNSPKSVSNDWSVGPIASLAQPSPGRCPGLGEHLPFQGEFSCIVRNAPEGRDAAYPPFHVPPPAHGFPPGCFGSAAEEGICFSGAGGGWSFSSAWRIRSAASKCLSRRWATARLFFASR